MKGFYSEYAAWRRLAAQASWHGTMLPDHVDDELQPSLAPTAHHGPSEPTQ